MLNKLKQKPAPTPILPKPDPVLKLCTDCIYSTFHIYADCRMCRHPSSNPNFASGAGTRYCENIRRYFDNYCSPSGKYWEPTKKFIKQYYKEHPLP